MNQRALTREEMECLFGSLKNTTEAKVANTMGWIMRAPAIVIFVVAVGGLIKFYLEQNYFYMLACVVALPSAVCAYFRPRKIVSRMAPGGMNAIRGGDAVIEEVTLMNLKVHNQRINSTSDRFREMYFATYVEEHTQLAYDVPTSKYVYDMCSPGTSVYLLKYNFSSRQPQSLILPYDFVRLINEDGCSLMV